MALHELATNSPVFNRRRLTAARSVTLPGYFARADHFFWRLEMTERVQEGEVVENLEAAGHNQRQTHGRSCQ